MSIDISSQYKKLSITEKEKLHFLFKGNELDFSDKFKEIRKINTPSIKSVSPTPTPIKEENTLDWLNSIVDHDQLNRQRAAETELIAINEDATPTEQKVVKSLNNAFTKDYSNLIKSMAKIPVK